jgi:hypothetical protein
MRHSPPRAPLAFSAQIHRSPSANLQAAALRASGPRPGDKSQDSRRCASRCAGSIRVQASSLTLRSRSAAVTQAIS